MFNFLVVTSFLAIIFIANYLLGFKRLKNKKPKYSVAPKYYFKKPEGLPNLDKIKEIMEKQGFEFEIAEERFANFTNNKNIKEYNFKKDTISVIFDLKRFKCYTKYNSLKILDKGELFQLTSKIRKKFI